MSEQFSEAISTDDSPAPEADDTQSPLLGDPETEANEDIYAADAGSDHDDVDADFANSDIQN